MQVLFSLSEYIHYIGSRVVFCSQTGFRRRRRRRRLVVVVVVSSSSLSSFCLCDSPLTGALTAEVNRYRKPLARTAASGLSASFVRYQDNRPTLKKATSFLRLHTPAVANVVATGSPNNCVCSVRCCFSCAAENLYLSMFCLTSTLVMGSFALFHGVFSRWLAGGRIHGSDDGSRVFWVEAGSAGVSIVVGLVWLVVSSIGKLNEVFYR